MSIHTFRRIFIIILFLVLEVGQVEAMHIERIICDTEVFRIMKPSLDITFLVVVLPEIVTHIVHKERRGEYSSINTATVAFW